ncbi:hypothetical protein ACO0LF_23130 [Undibacterium sp. Di27W]|uniref:hypothetical protein n=1 Tax=Undibacterium sp. Di27W TaxID=3413036 RepID=UPI003BF09622
MSYKLEQASIQDIEKILQDAKLNPSIKFRLERQRHFSLGRKWAVNESRDIYFFTAPDDVRDGYYPFYYLVFHKDNWYEVNTQYMCGNELVFDDDTPPPEGDARIALQNEIIAAFEVFGRFGEGNLQTNGQPRKPSLLTFKAPAEHAELPVIASSQKSMDDKPDPVPLDPNPSLLSDPRLIFLLDR